MNYRNLHKSIVTITTAHNPGMGFILDIELGFIATNKHLISKSYIEQQVEIKLFNNKTIEGAVHYKDPEHDIAIIQTTEDLKSLNCKCTSLNHDAINKNDTIFTLRNQFAIYGKVLDPHLSGGYFSTQIISTDLESALGDSGSPVWNTKEEVIGIQFAITNNKATLIHSAYIADILSSISSKSLPFKNSLGVIFDYCKLNDLKKYTSFPQERIEEYNKNYNKCSDKIICIKTTLDIPILKNNLQPLDVIWNIKDFYINCGLYALQKFINNSRDTIHLNIIRNGSLQKIDGHTYSLYRYQITSTLSINGMTVFQADELTHLITGAPLGSVVLDTSSTVVSIKKIDIYPAHNIKDVMSILPLCIYKKNFVLYTSSPKHHFNNLITMNQSVHANYFTLDEESLILFQYNNKTHNWLSYKITEHTICTTHCADNAKKNLHHSSNEIIPQIQETCIYDDTMINLIQGLE